MHACIYPYMYVSMCIGNPKALNKMAEGTTSIEARKLQTLANISGFPWSTKPHCVLVFSSVK